MWCRCTKRNSGFAAMPLPEGGFCYDLWVCNICFKPKLKVFEGLTFMYSPSRATALLSIDARDTGIIHAFWATETSGERIETVTYHPYPRKVGMDQGRNILLETWQKLDDSITIIRANPDYDMEHDKTRATALAEVIALMMPTFYESPEAVLRESMTRWTARQEQRDHESPGLAEKIWNPNTRFDGTPYSEENEARVRAGSAPKVTKRVALDDQKITFIKHCMTTGTMDAQTLAGMFGTSVEHVEEVAAS